MPDMSKGRRQTKRSPWYFGLGIQRGANDPTPEKCNATKPPEKKNHGGGQDPHRAVALLKKEITEYEEVH
jgi:hypothetical protein